MNESEFWSTMPLPSIAINDYRFHHNPKAGNDWSGAVEGLTTQRAVRALESYVGAPRGSLHTRGRVAVHLFLMLTYAQY